MTGIANAINESTVGITGLNGTAFVGTPLTQFTVLVGGSTSSTMAGVGPGSAGQVLQSGGNAANPAYSTATYPSTAGTSGNVLTSDGTNWTSSSVTSSSTWIPQLQFGGSGSGITYTTQSAFYSKVGNLVFINVNIVLSNKGSATGTATILGLPFLTTADICTQFAAVSNYSTAANYNQTFTQNVASSFTLGLYQQRDNAIAAFSTMSDTNFTNTSTINVSGFYITS